MPARAPGDCAATSTAVTPSGRASQKIPSSIGLKRARVAILARPRTMRTDVTATAEIGRTHASHADSTRAGVAIRTPFELRRA